MAILKQSGQGEQITVDIAQWNPVSGEICHDVNEMSDLFNSAMDIADLRIFEMNTRMMEAYKLREFFKPEEWSKVVSILDILAGRVDVATVRKRFDDAAEETRELEEMRQAAYNERMIEVTEAQLNGSQY
jgi:hypothetical protein